jgi:hypothetical protein
LAAKHAHDVIWSGFYGETNDGRELQRAPPFRGWRPDPSIAACSRPSTPLAEPRFTAIKLTIADRQSNEFRSSERTRPGSTASVRQEAA